MPDLKENAISLLARNLLVDMILDVPTLHELYHVPAGKKCIIDSVVIHSNTATLAGMIDVDLGGGAAAITPPWITTEAGIADMTAADDWMILRNDSNEIAMIDGDDSTAADQIFGMLVTAGSTGAATATIDVFGYLV